MLKPHLNHHWPRGPALLLVYICCFAVNIAPAQPPGTVRPNTLLGELNKSAKAEVSIASDQQMDFGQLADHDGAVVLGWTDLITSDPDFISYGGSPYSGIHTITGNPDTAVDISITTNPNGGLSLSNFKSNEGDLPLIGVVLDSGGQLILRLGATLTVDAENTSIGPGQSISYTITSIYN